MYCGRLVVPTVLRKAETRVPQQDLESLVLGFQWPNRRRELEEVRRRRGRDWRHRNPPVREIFRGQGAFESVGEIKSVAKQTELVMTIDDFDAVEIFFETQRKYYNF